MTKKKLSKKTKRIKRQLANHEQHHEAIHNYIMRKKMEDGEVEGVTVTPEHHAIPDWQPWHVPDAACPCFPKRLTEDPMTGTVVWQHSGYIH